MRRSRKRSSGGLAGKGIAEAIDPTTEEAYWRENFSGRPYVKGESKFDDYGPAYRHGAEAYGGSKGCSFPAIRIATESSRVGSAMIALPSSRVIAEILTHGGGVMPSPGSLAHRRTDGARLACLSASR
jgi:hypothetical protein